MARFMCKQGHLHRSPSAAVNCHYCRRSCRRKLQKMEKNTRAEGEAALARLHLTPDHPLKEKAAS